MEPWLTGKLTELHPAVAALLYSFEHARADLYKWTEGLSDQDIWRNNGQIASVGFHIRHIAGSIDRLMTYAAGGQLTEGQMAELKTEMDPKGPAREDLFAFLDQRLAQAAEVLKSIDVSDLAEIRYIGRKRVPVPLGVLLTHIAEHTQRHVGAAIVTAKLAAQSSS